MCLFPFFPMTSFVPPTSKSQKCVNQMRLLMYIQLFMGFLKLFLGFYTYIGGMDGMFELFSCCIIYMAYTQLSFCHCMIYITFCIYTVIIDTVTIGKSVQNGRYSFNEGRAIDSFAAIVNIISIAFYIIASYITFQAYKEFKALTLEMGGSFLPQSDRTYSDEFHQDYRPPNTHNSGYRPINQPTYQMQASPSNPAGIKNLKYMIFIYIIFHIQQINIFMKNCRNFYLNSFISLNFCH